MSAEKSGMWQKSSLFHGGDYYPEQWPESVRIQDVELMRKANCNAMSVGIFAWSQLEPAEGKYNWDWLDQTFERLHQAGVHILLATPSAAPPRWLTAAYPEVMAVDDRGLRGVHGQRQRTCPTNPVYRQHVARINTELAKRYGRHPAVLMWHVSNEYSGQCFCPHCAAEFRLWLKDRYQTLDNLNQQWWATFWSQNFTDWSQINPPFANAGNPESITGHLLDWRRFESHAHCEFFKREVHAIKQVVPQALVTTNMMGFFEGLDYAKFADVCDVITWDCYNTIKGDPAGAAFAHAYMRGIKQNNPWLLVEESPSATNWQQYGTLKPPGVLRLWSWQAVAHGSEGAMYFQWRRSRGSSEKMHGAVVEHADSADARVFKEVSALGAEYQKLAPALSGARVARAKVGILFDQECRWALQATQGYCKEKNYQAMLQKHFKALWGQHIPMNVVRIDDDWSQYDVLIAPVMYMVNSGKFPINGSPEQMRTRLDLGGKIEQWVAAGGTWISTYLSGIANENDQVYDTGYPGPLRKVLGIWVEEIDSTPPGAYANKMNMLPGDIKLAQQSYNCDLFFDQIHAESAKVLATYDGNWYAGKPCLTCNSFGGGSAYYIGTDADLSFLREFYRAVAAQKGISPVADAPECVEVLQRIGHDGSPLTFVLNHNDAPAEIRGLSGTDLLTGKTVSAVHALEPYAVRIVK